MRNTTRIKQLQILHKNSKNTRKKTEKLDVQSKH
jgi:hypothetical protein